MDALVVIDMQNDFITGSLGNKECVDVVKEVKKVCEDFKSKNEPIYFTMDTHDNNYLNTQEGRKLPVPHCIKPSDGWKIIEQLNEYVDKDKVIEKPTFGSMTLKDHLKDFDRIYICGVCTDICVISNAMILKAQYPEKEIYVIKDACAGVSVKSHENALEAMKSCQINII